MPPGTRLPSESACESHFKVSRPTIRQAMQKLVAEGLILRERGRGTFVAPLKVEHDIAFSFEEEMHASNLPVEPKLISWERIEPRPEIAATLRISAGELIFRLERLRLINNEPIGREIRHLPRYIGEKIHVADLKHQPVFRLLQQATNEKINRISYMVSAVPASPRDARLLRVRTGTPLLAREHLYFSEDDVPLLYGTTFFVGASYRFHFETGSKQIRMGSKVDKAKWEDH